METSQEIVRFVGTRKHIFKDKTYHVRFHNDILEMDENIDSVNPKYRIKMNLQTRIGWKLKLRGREYRLEAFKFLHNGRFKVMFAGHEGLLKLKLAINGKVLFDGVNEFFTPINYLGSGNNSKTVVCLNKISEKLNAVKAIPKFKAFEGEDIEAAFMNEIDIINKVNSGRFERHLSTIKIHELYDGDSAFYLVLDTMRGPTLQNELINLQQQEQSERQKNQKVILQKLLEQLDHLHKRGIILRDLKLESIMFRIPGDYPSLTLTDYSSAIFNHSQKSQLETVGIPGYIAPEVLNNAIYYTTKADMFACGCIAYQLFTGKKLFQARFTNQILGENKLCNINFHSEEFQKLSKQTLELLKGLLHKQRNLRLSAEAALKSSFFDDRQRLKIIKQASWRAISVEDEKLGEGTVILENEFESLEISEIQQEIVASSSDQKIRQFPKTHKFTQFSIPKNLKLETQDQPIVQVDFQNDGQERYRSEEKSQNGIKQPRVSLLQRSLSIENYNKNCYVQDQDFTSALKRKARKRQTKNSQNQTSFIISPLIQRTLLNQKKNTNQGFNFYDANQDVSPFHKKILQAQISSKVFFGTIGAPQNLELSQQL